MSEAEIQDATSPAPPDRANAGTAPSAPSSSAPSSGVAPEPIADDSASQAPAPRMPSDSAVLPSDSTAGRGGGCSCGGATGATAVSSQAVYALGQLGLDFGSEARRDSIQQQMDAGGHGWDRVLAHMDEHPWDAQSVIWTLNLDATPVYAIRPDGAFAGEVYGRLREFVKEQREGGIERISVGGLINGRARLLSGQVLPVISPELRCLHSWTTAALSDAASVSAAAGVKDAPAAEIQGAVAGFLERVYDELRNLGLAPEHRALNFAATNAFNAAKIFSTVASMGLELDGIAVERSPICRPDADCWDVELAFFDPENLMRARRIFRYTVDVSDVCPVTVGSPRSWSAR